MMGFGGVDRNRRAMSSPVIGAGSCGVLDLVGIFGVSVVEFK